MPCDLPTVGVMGVRKQLTYYSCLKLARWRLEYNPLWGKRRFSRTSAQCPHVGVFWFSFYVSFIFWAEVPLLLNGGIFKRLPTILDGTNVFAGNNVKAWEQTDLNTVIHSILTSASLNKSNGKQLFRKISLLRNKCDTMITTIFVIELASVCNEIPSLATCIVSLIAKSCCAI